MNNKFIPLKQKNATDNTKQLSRHLAEINIKGYIDTTCCDCGSGDADIDVDYDNIATAIDAAGYRKQSDTVKEFAEKVAAELYPEAMKYLNTDIGKGIAKAMVKVEEIVAEFG